MKSQIEIARTHNANFSNNWNTATRQTTTRRITLNQLPKARAMTDSGFNKSRPQNHVRRWLLPVVVIIGVIFAITIAMPRQGQATPQSLESVLTHAVRRGPMLVTVTEQGTLESARNTEIKCKVRGQNTVIEVVESGTYVNPGDVLVRLDTLFIEEQIAERTPTSTRWFSFKKNPSVSRN